MLQRSKQMSEEKQKRCLESKDENSDTLELSSIKPITKKRKVLPHEELYLENLPCADAYEKSYMHRDVVIHCVAAATDFIITASCDGHIKFWKKVERGIEFVKHFRSHLGPITSISVNCNGTLLCSVSSDKSVKIFDILNFDMINMMYMNFVPNVVEWIHGGGDAIQALAVADADSSHLYIYDGKGTQDVPLKILDKMHKDTVILIKYNVPMDTTISVDKKGILEYWGGSKIDYTFPRCVSFESKLDTHLFEFVKNKTVPTCIAFSPDGLKFATTSLDRRIRIFNFLTGKMLRVFDESLPRFMELQQSKQLLPNMEFGRRMAVERDLEKTDSFQLANVVFDKSGFFILYATMLGIKLVNIHTNRCIKIIGKQENFRILQIALYQGSAKRSKATVTFEMEASENPTLEAIQSDPTIICTAYKKPRFYLFSRHEPDESSSTGLSEDRDVFNEKPSKEETMAAMENPQQQRLFDSAIIHTVFGDIHLKLFYKDCPKAVENFCVHSKNGYYNGHIFHRVIKGFMVQTGDPTGNGTGGESIWGGEFEDEFAPHLRHDRPYTVSMANAGPNTNGSQFFITLAPTPWLDNKHTVFGRVVKGMEVIQNIGNVRTNPKTDKPYDDIRIVSISVK